ncbi:MAG: transcriptional regulator CynR [Gordonia sp. (in: high G+C Gram-positive bacteria)]|jgi:LysR family cyn operon transcriptional activator|nr:transcriptional regulator CynR [Gordonia sp. (in: high G+C Gram-positive bacteria)]
MSVELRHLRYLLAVVEQGTFTRAADHLHVSQPTLSQQIKQLERSVGMPLLERGSRAVRLTDVGAVYVEHARRALRELAVGERAVHDVRDNSRGRLRIGVTPTFTAYLVGPLVAEFHGRYPGITIDISETTQDRIEAGLVADDLDLGIGFAGPHASGVDASPLFIETISLVSGGADLRDDVAPVPVRSLADRRLALLTRDFATRRHIDAYLTESGVEPAIVMECDTIQALLEIVQCAGLATVLPDEVTRDRSGLTSIGLVPPLPSRTVVLLRRDGGYCSAAARAFIAVADEFVSAHGYERATDH